MKLTRSNITLLICAVITFGGAFYYFVFFNADTGSAISVSEGTTPAGEAEASFLALVGQLGTITLDTRLFTDPRFTSLVDIKTSISPEPGGRKDPFAAIPGIVSQ